MTLVRRHCIYCAPETWERLRRCARRIKMPLSRFGVLCCRKAEEEGTPGAVRTSGHALAIPKDRQRRFCADVEIIWRAGHITLDEEEGDESGVFTSDVTRFLRLTEPEEHR